MVQAWAPPHFGWNVVGRFNDTFNDRWIAGRGPVQWPARSHDQNPICVGTYAIIGLCGDNKQHRATTRENWEHSVAHSKPEDFKAVYHYLLVRCQACIKADGVPFLTFAK